MQVKIVWEPVPSADSIPIPMNIGIRETKKKRKKHHRHPYSYEPSGSSRPCQDSVGASSLRTDPDTDVFEIVSLSLAVNRRQSRDGFNLRAFEQCLGQEAATHICHYAFRGVRGLFFNEGF